MSLFKLFEEEKEDVHKVIKELSTTCTSCRLSILHPYNKGLIWRGNPEAKIAVIAEAPGDTESERGVPLVGRSGQEFERWMKRIGIDTRNQILISNILQCQPDKKKGKDGKPSQEAPKPDEIVKCFGPRCMRVLKAMPNLEVLITMGWVAAPAILGGDPKGKTHEGQWFESSLLPGIAIFCLPHPAGILRDKENNPDADASVIKSLEYFKREYLESEKDIVGFAQAVKTKRAETDGGLF